MILPLKPKYISYKIYGIFAEHNHSILLLPPYHPELNPIELIWATVKNWVAQNNTTFKMDDVINRPLKHVIEQLALGNHAATQL
jgi:transposase